MPKTRFEMIINKDFPYSFDETICKQCKASCCKGEGYVFLSKYDIDNISSFLGLDVGQFVKLYTRKTVYGKKVSLVNLKIKGELRCVFLDKFNRCEIYEVRPNQCREFPFWKSLKNKNGTQLAKLCPGIIIS